MSESMRQFIMVRWRTYPNAGRLEKRRLGGLGGLNSMRDGGLHHPNLARSSLVIHSPTAFDSERIDDERWGREVGVHHSNTVDWQLSKR